MSIYTPTYNLSHAERVKCLHETLKSLYKERDNHIKQQKAMTVTSADISDEGTARELREAKFLDITRVKKRIDLIEILLQKNDLCSCASCSTKLPDNRVVEVYHNTCVDCQELQEYREKKTPNRTVHA